MKRKLRIAFDIDGVLCNLQQYVVDKLGLTLSALYHYDEFVRLLGGRDAWRDRLRTLEARKRADPIMPFVNLFREMCRGDLEELYDPLIITSTSHLPDIKVVTSWLIEYLGIENVELHFTNRKTRVDFDAIIEDNPAQVKAAARKGRLAFMVNRPWTRTVIRQKSDGLVFFLPEDDAAAADEIRTTLSWYSKFAGR